MKGIYYLYNSTVVFKALRNYPGFKSLFYKVDKVKTAGAMKILDKVVTESGLKEKYSNIDISKLNPTGNRVWMFWYTGFETAPPLVKKCLEEAKKVKDIDLVLLDKNNLEDYFTFESNIRELFQNGSIPLVKLTNIMRTQLITRHGGLWCDATVYMPHKDIISRIQDKPFYSVKHFMDWHFGKGRWTGFFTGGGIGNPITSFLYDTLVEYYKHYNWHFDYFQFDYTWLYAYTHFDWAKQLIDSLPDGNPDINYIQKNWDKPFNKEEWDSMIKDNEIQKLNWKAAKLPEDKSIETIGRHFLES